MSTAPSLGVLYVLMFFSGLGFIGSQVLTNAYIVTAYPEHLRGPAIGWALSIGRLGAIVGPLLGGVILSSGLSVQWNFYAFAIPAAVGVVATLLVPKVIGRSASNNASPTPTPPNASSRSRSRQDPHWKVTADVGRTESRNAANSAGAPTFHPRRIRARTHASEL